MALSEILLPEFEHETAITRRFLERVPEDRPDFRPHPRSMTLARLAGHLAELPFWATVTLTDDSIDVAPPGGGGTRGYVMTTRAELLAKLDHTAVAAREAIARVTDPQLAEPWSLKNGGRVVFTMPRLSVFRSWVMSHMVHHRAQLGVYLRMNEIAIPATYGPSGDERV